MLTTLRNSSRLFTIAWTLARNDALFGLKALGVSPIIVFVCSVIARKPKQHMRRGERLAHALESLGPTFIKAGQALSTRPDIIGEDIVADLARLRDQLPCFDTAIAKRIIEAELGAPISELFTQFEDTPVGAASIAQVHFATTPDGRDVAVKVLRPNINEAFKRDIAMMYWVADIVIARAPQLAKRLKPREVVKQFENTVALELDLRFEAAAAAELKHNTRNDKGIYVPVIDWQRTSQSVLTTERIRGISLGDIDAVKAAFPDMTRLVEHAASTFFNQVFRDGFFHADMHPGNIFILPDATIAVIDFGIMGRIDRHTQMFLAEILWGFLREDYLRVAKVHVEYGYSPPHIDVHALAQACRAIGQPILGKSLNEISVGRLIGQLLQVATTFEMEAHPHLLLLQKTMMTAEGVGRMLNPDVNMWKLSEPMIAAWAKQNFSVRARVKDTLEEGSQALAQLPRLLKDMQRFLERDEAAAAPPSAHIGLAKWLWLGWAAFITLLLYSILE